MRPMYLVSLSYHASLLSPITRLCNIVQMKYILFYLLKCLLFRSVFHHILHFDLFIFVFDVSFCALYAIFLMLNRVHMESNNK